MQNVEKIKTLLEKLPSSEIISDFWPINLSLKRNWVWVAYYHPERVLYKQKEVDESFDHFVRRVLAEEAIKRPFLIFKLWEKQDKINQSERKSDIIKFSE